MEETKAVDVGKGVIFDVPQRLEFIRKVGSGAYGTVASFKDGRSGEKIAVKKITNAFEDLVDAKRILREIKLLRHCDHDNIIRILDMYPPPTVDFEDIYIVTDLMESDLHRVVYSKQPLTDEHYQYFCYQLLRGIKYLHSAGIVHRDLKPANILVNKNCDLKICDFGLARGFQAEEEDDPNLTDYVVTRWYRAPEVVLIASEYTKAIDIWSIGCILCEMIGRKALFTGKDHLDQIKKIVSVVGMPPPEDLDWLPKDGPARRFMAKCPQDEGQKWEDIYPNANPLSLDIADKMLTFNPDKRILVDDALAHEYFEGLHSPDDEPMADSLMDWGFDNFKPTKRLLQNKTYAECAAFHPLIVGRDEAGIKEREINVDEARPVVRKEKTEGGAAT